MNNYSTSSAARPEAWVTRDRNRLKQYADKVYLNKGDEFEIELYNPTSQTVLAKIWLNGNLTSQSGLVLKPAERVFLDRYLDVDRKYLFDTYEVKNTVANQKAIEANGNLEIKFYKEQEISLMSFQKEYWFGSTLKSSPGTTTDADWMNLRTFTTSTDDSISTFCSQSSYDGMQLCGSIGEPTRKKKKSIETGRVEKGDKSNQVFNTIDLNFNSYHDWTTSWEILPYSQKRTVASTELKSYCTRCGTRKKKSGWKFCPSCGNKI